MPDDVAIEKVHALQALGADIERVRPASIVDKKQASCNPFPFRLHFSSQNSTCVVPST